MKTKNLHLFYYLLLLVVMVGTPWQAMAQGGSWIEGKVTDSAGEPLIGATVLVKDTNAGVTTSVDGTFRLNLPTKNAVLQVSFMGYETKEIATVSRSQFNIVLESDDMQLEEVVVVGYGTQTKASITGALSTVDTESLIKAPVASITNVLAGSVPGVSSVQTTGQPGADVASIYVRGVGSLNSSTPLVLVDGIEREFSQLDPNEIESFSILKDAASTAVFGVRGANGVIIITTKRGSIGKPTITVSSNTGVQQPIGYLQTVGSYEYATFWNAKQELDGVTSSTSYFSDEAIEAFRTGSDPIMYPNMDWSEEIFNDVFIQTKNNINISGGTENVRYFVSMGYLFQDGIIKQIDALSYNNNYKYERYNYRTNLDVKLSPTTDLKFNVGGNIGTTQSPNAIQDIEHIWIYTSLWTLPFAGAGLVDGVVTKLPNNFFYDNGGITREGYSGFYGYGYEQDIQTTLNVDIDVTQKLDFITEGLTLSVKGGLDSWYQVVKDRTGGGFEYQTVNYQSYLDDTLKPTTDLDYDKTLVYTPTSTNTPLVYSASL